MTFRIGQMGKLQPISRLKELPFGSILHVLDNFQMEGLNYPVTVSKDNPILNLNTYKMMMVNVVHPTQVDKEWAPVVIDRMIFVNSGVVPALLKYKSESKGKVLYFNSLSDLPVRGLCQCVVNYNPLFRPRVTGMRRRPRLMNMIFATVINKIMEAPDRDHFIHIPLEALRFERKDFVRAFRKYDRIATKYPDISSYLFLAHLYCILYKGMDLPKRGSEFITEEDAPETAATESFSGDFDIHEEENFLTNVAEYALDSTDAAMEVMKMKDTENPYTNSIFEFLPAAMFEKVNFIVTCGKNYIAFNLRDMKDLSGRNGSAINRVINYFNMLAASGAAGASTTPDSTSISEDTQDKIVAEDLITIDETASKSNQPEFKQPLTTEERKFAIDQDLAELEDVEKILKDTIKDRSKPLSAAQKERIKTISVAYKKCTINGKTFEEIMGTIPDIDISDDISKINEAQDKTESAEKPAKGFVDLSKTKSTTASLDSTYVQKMMDRDIAAIVTSFNKQGMFLTDFDAKELVDEMNEKVVYTAKYEDTNHKTHTIKFSLPKVDKFGRFKDNGSYKAMSKQRVSNPITKARATRVTLNSNYNKVLVERNENAANSFLNWFIHTLHKMQEEKTFSFKLFHGACKYPIIALPFELTEIGSRFTKITFSGGYLTFDIASKEAVASRDDNFRKYGHFFGRKSNDNFYMNVQGVVTVLSSDNEEVFVGSFIDFLEWLTGVTMKPMTEYAEMTLLSKVMPVIHPLAYRYGLTNMLKYCSVNYVLYEANERFERKTSDIVIKFADKKLVIDRTPRVNALLFGGLSIYDFDNVMFEDMDGKDIYYELLAQKKISPNMIKGIDSFFNLFIDPITKDILREMKEPTDVRDLLIRAVSMLTTSDHREEASAANFRFRGVEQMTDIVYNEMSKAFANFQNKSPGSTNKFSISEYAVKQRILQEQLMENVSIINPLHDIKTYSKFSNAGSGGRSNDTFMITDRQFTTDSIGVVSEATVDNGKTGLNAMLPFNPVFANIRGMVTTGEPDLDKLEPENILSLNSLLMPCVTNDD